MELILNSNSLSLPHFFWVTLPLINKNQPVIEVLLKLYVILPKEEKGKGAMVILHRKRAEWFSVFGGSVGKACYRSRQTQFTFSF